MRGGRARWRTGLRESLVAALLVDMVQSSILRPRSVELTAGKRQSSPVARSEGPVLKLLCLRGNAATQRSGGMPEQRWNRHVASSLGQSRGSSSPAPKKVAFDRAASNTAGGE